MTREPIILLVEDNPGDIRLIEKAVGDAARLEIARTGAEAAAYLRREGARALAPEPDIVILDLNLPCLDGRALLRHIKEDPDLLHIPVIVLTSSKAEEDVGRCYALHGNCYVIKPSEWQDFKEMMQDILRFWFKTVRLPRRA